MMSSLKSYGFEYEYEGRKFAFAVDAESSEEAQGRVVALASAVAVGALYPHDQAEMIAAHKASSN